MVKALIVREGKSRTASLPSRSTGIQVRNHSTRFILLRSARLASVKARAGIANRRSSQRRARAVRMQQRHSRPTCSIRADARVAQV